METTILHKWTLDFLNNLSIKHASHYFHSGAIMLDIWYGNSFYVLHFEDSFIGFSEVIDDNIGFDNIPDEKVYDLSSLKQKLESVFN